MAEAAHDANERIIHANSLAMALNYIALNVEGHWPDPSVFVGLSEGIHRALNEAQDALEAERRKAAE